MIIPARRRFRLRLITMARLLALRSLRSIRVRLIQFFSWMRLRSRPARTICVSIVRGPHRCRWTAAQIPRRPLGPIICSSLWQLNMVAVLVERFFGAKVVGSNAVAMITGAKPGSSP